MDTLRKCDTRNLATARRKQSQHAFRSMGQAERANSSGSNPDGVCVNRQSFAEDFMAEHCKSSLQMTLIGIAASYGSASRESQPSAQSYGFPS